MWGAKQARNQHLVHLSFFGSLKTDQFLKVMDILYCPNPSLKQSQRVIINPELKYLKWVKNLKCLKYLKWLKYLNLRSLSV